jgi:hypothetical protein
MNLKKIESLKEAKKIQRDQLAKKHDEMISNLKPKEEVKEEIVKKKKRLKGIWLEV